MDNEVKYGIWFIEIDSITKKTINHGFLATTKNKEYAEIILNSLELSFNRPKNTKYIILNTLYKIK